MHWYMPKPPAEANVLDDDNLRFLLEDAREELLATIDKQPQGDKQRLRNQIYNPSPSLKLIELALGCDECKRCIPSELTSILTLKQMQSYPQQGGRSI